jgi:hypothetical protein
MKFETPWQAGDQRRTLTVSMVSGAGMQFYVFLDMYFQGQVLRRNGQWVGYFNNNLFTAEDVEILGEMISERMEGCLEK